MEPMNTDASTVSSEPKVLLIGWDAADWRVAKPLIEQGLMPNLQRLMEQGVHGDLRTLYPCLSPMLWTSIATGKRPQKHGIHGFSEVCPQTGAIRPISGRSRKTKALWNILGQNGLRSNVVGWWPSHPAEPIQGCMVSNFFQHVPARQGDYGERLPAGTAHPPQLLEDLAPLRVHPDEFNQNHLGPFLPHIHEMDWQTDQRVHTCARMLAECTSIHAAATWLMQKEPWNFMGVYYDAIDHFCHGFMKYHPPRRKAVSEADFKHYQSVVNTAYRYHDSMLGTLLEIAGEDCTVLLISDHGFYCDHLRPDSIPLEPAGPASEHRPQGIFVAKGPGIRAGKQVSGISLLDIAPTILQHCGLPVGADMDGEVIQDIFTRPAQPDLIPSWDAVSASGAECAAGEGAASAEPGLSYADNQAALRQLVELGYIDAPNADAETARAHTQRELDYNLARAHMDAAQYPDAAALLERLWADYPEEPRFAMQLLSCYERLQRPAAADRLIHEIIEVKSRTAKDHEDSLKAMLEAHKARKEAGEHIPEEDSRKLRDAFGRAQFNPLTLAQLQIRSKLLQQEPEALVAAAEMADKLLERVPDDSNLLLLRARIHSQQEEWVAAEAAYRRILSLEPQHEASFVGLAYLCLRRRDYWQAAANARLAVQHDPKNQWAQYYYGCALLGIGKPRLGIEALHAAVKLDPRFVEAWQRLTRYYSRAKKVPNARRKATYCKQQADRAREALDAGSPYTRSEAAAPDPEFQVLQLDTLRQQVDEALRPLRAPRRAHHSAIVHEDAVTIVTGLPRCGSSMLMQMLAAGGIPPLTDGLRVPDDNNPHGFFEFEPVKSGRAYQEWMPRARRHAVKIVAPLIPAIPKDEHYRVVFCHRPMPQILASQARMLERLGKPAGSDPIALEIAYLQHIRKALGWLRRQRIPVLLLDYTQTIEQPDTAAARLNHFLGGQLDPAAMAAAIDPALHRERQVS